jgi:hypothetical protein
MRLSRQRRKNAINFKPKLNELKDRRFQKFKRMLTNGFNKLSSSRVPL